MLAAIKFSPHITSSLASLEAGESLSDLLRCAGFRNPAQQTNYMVHPRVGRRPMATTLRDAGAAYFRLRFTALRRALMGASSMLVSTAAPQKLRPSASLIWM